MLNFSKSREDLKKSKTDVQHRVICDWLRNIQNQNIQLARKITNLTNLINDSLSENEGSPEDMEGQNDDSRTSTL